MKPFDAGFREQLAAVHARAAGLGVGWISIIGPDDVKGALFAPDEWTLVAYLRAGWPARVSGTPELEAAGREKREAKATRSARR